MDKQYKELFIEIRKIVNQSDPISLISQGAPEDEYEEEVQKIIAGLKICKDVQQVHLLIYNIFKDNFGDNSVGNLDLYLKPAKRIFNFMSKQKV